MALRGSFLQIIISARYYDRHGCGRCGLTVAITYAQLYAETVSAQNEQQRHPELELYARCRPLIGQDPQSHLFGRGGLAMVRPTESVALRDG